MLLEEMYSGRLNIFSLVKPPFPCESNLNKKTFSRIVYHQLDNRGYFDGHQMSVPLGGSYVLCPEEGIPYLMSRGGWGFSSLMSSGRGDGRLCSEVQCIMGNGHMGTTMWTDRHDWKHHLPATSLAGGNFYLTRLGYMILAKHSVPSVLHYRPETKFAKVIFYNCLSVILFTGGGGVCIQGGLHAVGLGRHPPPPIGYYGIQPTSGRYASYWNAFCFR